MLKTQLPVSLRPRLLRLGWETISLVSSCLAEEVFTQFLRWVADWKENIVIRRGGVSPWFSNLDRDLLHDVRVPSDDDGEDFIFNSHASSNSPLHR